MQNFSQSGDVLTLTAPYVRTSGQGMLVGSLFAVCTSGVASGAAVECLTEGVFLLDKNSAEAWTVGLKLYWDNTAKVVTLTATSNTLIGCAAAVAANPSSQGYVFVDGVIR